MKYRKKPVFVEAVQFTGENYKECEKHVGKGNYDNTIGCGPNITNRNGITIKVLVGDWVVKGADGVLEHWIPENFNDQYEKVIDDKVKATDEDIKKLRLRKAVLLEMLHALNEIDTLALYRRQQIPASMILGEQLQRRNIITAELTEIVEELANP